MYGCKANIIAAHPTTTRSHGGFETRMNNQQGIFVNDKSRKKLQIA